MERECKAAMDGSQENIEESIPEESHHHGTPSHEATPNSKQPRLSEQEHFTPTTSPAIKPDDIDDRFDDKKNDLDHLSNMTPQSAPHKHLQLVKAASTNSANKDTMICREWQTEMSDQKLKSNVFICTNIPEKDSVLWQIKDFAAFRAIAKSSKIPPLASPQFGGGCYLKLFLHHTKKGHIVAKIELPAAKTFKEGIAHLKLSILKPDMKPLLVRKLEFKSRSILECKNPKLKKASNAFRLSQKTLFGRARYTHLIFDDSLRLKIEFQYFPYDNPIFRGMERSDPTKGHFISGVGDMTEQSSISRSCQAKFGLLQDIENFCEVNPSQYIEIKHEEGDLRACRFLLIARSKKFAELLRAIPGNSSRSLHRCTLSNEVAPGIASLTIQNVSFACLEQMIMYIHTDRCPWTEDYTTHLLDVLELFEAAKIYEVESLQRRLLEQLDARLDRDNFALMYQSAERTNDMPFKTICMKYMDSLPGSQVAALMHASSSCQSCGQTPRPTS